MSDSAVDAYGPPRAVCDRIRAAKRIALAGHVTPDADCLGSIGAMDAALRAMNLLPLVSMPAGSVSRKLQFMVAAGGWSPATAQQLAACDLLIAMDTARDKRVNIEGKLEALPHAHVVNIDHHASNTRFGHVQWIDGARSSTCEMIYELLRALEAPVTPTIATLLYAGIHNDTQGFSLPNTTARSLAVAHDLAAAGAAIADTCEKLDRSYSPGEFALLRAVYANTRVSDDGMLGWSTLDHAEIAAAGCTPEDIDDQVEIVRSIEGVRVAVLFSEGNKGKVRMNFRGDRGMPVLELARQFNGGGHDMAAGAILDGSVPAVCERVLPAARDYIAGRCGGKG